MRTLMLIEIFSNDESELNGMENAIYGTINNREYMADEDISTSVYTDEDAIERGGDIYLEHLQKKRRKEMKKKEGK